MMLSWYIAGGLLQQTQTIIDIICTQCKQAQNDAPVAITGPPEQHLYLIASDRKTQ